MTIVEAAEKAMQSLETAQTFGTGISSGMSLTTEIVRDHNAYKAAAALYREHPSLMVPVLLDRMARYLQIDPRPYEHPNDATVFAFLLLTYDVCGPDSSEMKMVAAAADLLPNPWWTRQFIERMRAASQSGG